jgi:hypothetical protein
MRLIVLSVFMLGLLSFGSADAQSSPLEGAGIRFGINHISGVEEDTPDARYARALELGAQWNRWPIYWDRVETAPGEWNWAAYDRLVMDDLAQGLHINAILLGIPAFHRDNARIAGMHQPIYADGSDTPRPGKALNPENPWVNFVAAAVERYRPGGTLAEEQGWPEGMGIHLWEVWNEPDYEPFWSGSIPDYARLLKSAYLVIKQIDPELQVMFGGLLFPTQNNWLARVLAIYQEDPFVEENNWYMDLIGIHSYSYPWRSGWLGLYIRQTLIAYEIDKPVWLNESGVPVWDDYPGRHWAQTADEKVLHATMQQQAHFFIQSTTYALAEGVDAIFFHQLYDDCGNRPGNFPYHNGALCEANPEGCTGDAFGMFRNPSSAVCYNHHPLPDTARPVTQAYRLMVEVFGGAVLTDPLIALVDNRATVISLDRGGQRITVAWNTSLDPVGLRLYVGDGALEQYTLLGRTTVEADDDGWLELDLAPAACDYFPFLNEIDLTGIGGAPVILVGARPPAPEVPDLIQPVVSPRSRCPRD